jgi:hypothetical protein
MIEPGVVEDLRMELAVMKDLGGMLVKLCYKQEGDTPLLCATTFDHWGRNVLRLQSITDPNIPADQKAEHLPSVIENATALGHNQQQVDNLVQETTARLRPVYEKMFDDSNGRLRRTLMILRACRLFNYHFVARTPLPALQQELAKIVAIARCYDHRVDLANELADYKAKADEAYQVDEDDRIDRWEFWLMNAIVLPCWFECAKEAALFTPSSCTVERVFSMLVQAFGDGQAGALEDYLCASVTVRYNSIWVGHDNEHNEEDDDM